MGRGEHQNPPCSLNVAHTSPQGEVNWRTEDFHLHRRVKIEKHDYEEGVLGKEGCELHLPKWRQRV